MLKLVVDNVPKKAPEKFLSGQELIDKLQTVATVRGREQLIVDNLKKLGL